MNMDVLILCGGLGTRLREVVSDRPKPMAEFQDRPFLDLLIDYFQGFGLSRFILCTGFQADVIRDHYTGRQDIEVVISHEEFPLGTAGAIKNAEPHLQSGTLLVANGDSLCRADLQAFAEFHREQKALLSILLAKSDDPEDYGSVGLDEEQRIISFEEKQLGQRHAYVSAGIYLFERKVLHYITPEIKQSLEYDVFPQLIKANDRCYGYTGQAEVLDIGTPQRLQRARNELSPPSSS